MRRFLTASAIAAFALASTPALRTASAQDAAASAETQSVVVHLSKFTNDLHAPFMAIKIANMLRSHGAEVTIFLDMEAARIADPAEDLDVRWGGGETPLGAYCEQFLDGGGRAVVCPHCAEHVGVGPGNIREGVTLGDESMLAELFLKADKVIDY